MAACEPPSLQSPAEKSITEKQTRIAWTSVAGATG
jgi:hypothetical protein